MSSARVGITIAIALEISFWLSSNENQIQPDSKLIVTAGLIPYFAELILSYIGSGLNQY